MKRVLALIFLSATLGQANDEITIELPGGVPLEMVWIEPGSFIMGAPEVRVTPREVTISQGFYLGKYEITQEQWQAVMGTALWLSDLSDYQGQGTHPAIGITWHDAQAFAQRLNDHFGEDAYRLPTEAEWEYACRAGTTTRWFFGDDESLLASYAWYGATPWGEAGVKPVGAKLPNPWGLFDMYGNAQEWVHDWHSYEDHDGTPQTDPSGPISGYYRIQRGGNYFGGAIDVSSAARNYDDPGLGFGGYSADASSARILKGVPLNIVIPERIPFPQDSTGPFFPAHEGNIWIMANHTYGYGPPSVDTTAYVLESQIIEGEQYWVDLGLGLLSGSFRLDENGNIWERHVGRASDGIREFLRSLDERPELRESQYYQQSSRFKNLDPDQEYLLLYDFDQVVIDPDSPTLELDYAVSNLYAYWIDGKIIMRDENPAPNQRLFHFSCCGSEASGGFIIFQRGLGPVRIRWRSSHSTSTKDRKLLWTRIDGKEYGLHPGPSYPGYRETLTAVASPELTSTQPAISGLDPNFPNPFNTSTQIVYRLASPGPVRLTIYNILGQPIRTLVDQSQPAGSYQVRWDARDQRGTALAGGGLSRAPTLSRRRTNPATAPTQVADG